MVVSERDLAGIIQDGNVSHARHALLQYTARLFSKISNYSSVEEEEWELDETQNRAGMLVSKLERLDRDTTAEELRKMLLGITRGVSDGNSSYVENSELAVEIWGELINELYPGTPTPRSTEFISAPRYQGWDLPAGEVLYVFGEDECFERIKTSKGKMLDSMLQTETELSRWTSFSC